MARYIDADALKERLSLVGAVADDLYGMGINRGLDRAETEIDMLPTADVVPVVRCKNCNHLTEDGFCFKNINGVGGYKKPRPDDFCSCGEKKENGDGNV